MARRESISLIHGKINIYYYLTAAWELLAIFIILYIIHRYINNEIKYYISLFFIVILMEKKKTQYSVDQKDQKIE